MRYIHGNLMSVTPSALCQGGITIFIELRIARSMMSWDHACPQRVIVSILVWADCAQEMNVRHKPDMDHGTHRSRNKLLSS